MIDFYGPLMLETGVRVKVKDAKQNLVLIPKGVAYHRRVGGSHHDNHFYYDPDGTFSGDGYNGVYNYFKLMNVPDDEKEMEFDI